MLFKKDILDRIAARRVTVAFRRWQRPSLKPGGTLATPVGVLAIESVSRVAIAKITDADLKRSGHPSRAALLREIAKHPGGDVYRVAFRLKAPEAHAVPRAEARPAKADGKVTKSEMKTTVAALKQLDQSSDRGAWTVAMLRLIDKYPARRPFDLAASQRRDPLAFKRDVLRLKQLGLTENLEIGYRLSPRGRAVLAELGGTEERYVVAALPGVTAHLPPVPRIILPRAFVR